MKKSLQVISKIVIAVMLMTCLCFTINYNRSHADAGYHSSYSGGSSSHSSSSHSSSSHSSSRSSGSSYSSSSSSGGGSFASFVVWIIIIVIIIIITSRKNKGISPTVKLQSNTEAVEKLKKLFEGFDEKQFLQNGYQIFLDVEDAWMNFNMEKVHNSITDELFNMYESQLSSMEIKGEQNIMSDFKLKDCAITKCTEENGNVEVTAKYIIEFYDYIINKESGAVLRGSKTRKLRMHYDFTFIVNKSQEKVTHCPNCGAEVNVNSAGTCEYCGSKIVSDSTSWVMSKKVCTRQENL